MRNQTLIIIDGNFLSHSCRFTNQILYKGRECGVIRCFFERIIDLSQSYKTTSFAFAWDSRHSWRKKKYDWYKEKRREARKEFTEQEKEDLRSMYRQIDVLKQNLADIGFSNVLEQNGLEGDDLIAMLVRNYGDRRIIMVANDHDLYQLLDSNVSMLTPRGDYLGKEYKKKDFEEEWGISPQLWADVKAIAGCSTDEVPGVGRDENTGEIIARIGEKTAANFLAGKLKSSSKVYARIVADEAVKIRQRNDELVRLPHKKTKPVLLKQDNLNFNAFKRICKSSGFKDFLTDRLDEWQTMFEHGY